MSRDLHTHLLQLTSRETAFDCCVTCLLSQTNQFNSIWVEIIFISRIVQMKEEPVDIMCVLPLRAHCSNSNLTSPFHLSDTNGKYLCKLRNLQPLWCCKTSNIIFVCGIFYCKAQGLLFSTEIQWKKKKKRIKGCCCCCQKYFDRYERTSLNENLTVLKKKTWISHPAHGREHMDVQAQGQPIGLRQADSSV